MSDIFISHAERDYATVEAVARGLESAGYATWFHERDSAGGASYLIQTREAIVEAKAVVLIVSRASLASHQVTKEVVRAHETHRPLIPLLVGVTDAQYKELQPEWEEAIGAATSLVIPPEGVDAILPRVLRGLQKMGISPGGPVKEIPAPPQPVQSTVSAPPASPMPPSPRQKSYARVLVAGLIGMFIVLAGFINFANASFPRRDEARLYEGFPMVRVANLLANAANVLLAIILLLGCVLVMQSRPLGGRLIRGAAGGMLAMSVLWMALSLAGAMVAPTWAYISQVERATMVGGIVVLGSFSVLLTGTVVLLFWKTE
jgi:hypothetical protein